MSARQQFIWEHAVLLFDSYEWLASVELFGILTSCLEDPCDLQRCTINQGLIYARLGNIKEAHELFQKAVDSGPASVIARCVLAEAEVALGNPRLARHWYESCLPVLSQELQADEKLHFGYCPSQQAINENIMSLRQDIDGFIPLERVPADAIWMPSEPLPSIPLSSTKDEINPKRASRITLSDFFKNMRIDTGWSASPSSTAHRRISQPRSVTVQHESVEDLVASLDGRNNGQKHGLDEGNRQRYIPRNADGTSESLKDLAAFLGGNNNEPEHAQAHVDEEIGQTYISRNADGISESSKDLAAFLNGRNDEHEHGQAYVDERKQGKYTPRNADGTSESSKDLAAFLDGRKNRLDGEAHIDGGNQRRYIPRNADGTSESSKDLAAFLDGRNNRLDGQAHIDGGNQRRYIPRNADGRSESAKDLAAFLNGTNDEQTSHKQEDDRAGQSGKQKYVPRNAKGNSESLKELAEFLRYAGPAEDERYVVDRDYMLRLLEGAGMNNTQIRETPTTMIDEPDVSRAAESISSSAIFDQRTHAKLRL